MLASILSYLRLKDYTNVDFDTLRSGCIDGVEAARRALVQRYEPIAWRAVRCRLPRASQQDQEEVVADTFIALLRDDAALLARYNALKGLSPEGWIRRQAMLQANNKARSLNSRKRRSEVLAPSADDNPALRTHADATPTAEIRLMEQESLRGLLFALEDRLTPAIALTFETLYVRGLEPNEAADVMGCTVDTVYTRKRRLTLALQSILDERESRGSGEEGDGGP